MADEVDFDSIAREYGPLVEHLFMSSIDLVVKLRTGQDPGDSVSNSIRSTFIALVGAYNQALVSEQTAEDDGFRRDLGFDFNSN